MTKIQIIEAAITVVVYKTKEGEQITIPNSVFLHKMIKKKTNV
jgi:hypothetical protein